MKKIDLNTNVDKNIINDFIKEIQREFPEHVINDKNVIDFSLLLESNKKCLSCKGLDNCLNETDGYKLVYDEESFKYSPCRFLDEKNKKAKNRNLIKTLYLPTKILEARIENYDVNTESRKKIFSKINEFITASRNNEYAKGLYLYGTFSIGKTYTLACIANELARNNIESLLIYFPDLVTDLKNAISDNNRYESLINMLKSIPVLMLDDLGSENMTPWVRDEVLGPIINYRVLENKPVFISSNIKPNDLKGHLAIDKSPESMMKAERIISRMNALMNSINMDDSNKYAR
ncbi:MAG: primosomal protein DnaI [Acholeplasmatales bacterium]|nr:primosomal protein DnaI [Acholeplasmatales bacterium]